MGYDQVLIATAALLGLVVIAASALKGWQGWLELKARELDRGWRIDHLLGNAPAAERFASGDICRAGGMTVSDHAPVSIDLR